MRRIRSLMKGLLAIAALAGCCAGGAAISGLLRPVAKAVSEEAPAESEASAPEGTAAAAAPAGDEVPDGTPETVRVDRLLTDGRYAEALTHADALREKTEGPAKDVLNFRRALCLELLGRRQDALEIYADLATRCPETPAGIAAVVGQARIGLRAGKVDRVRRDLAVLLLRTGRGPVHALAPVGDAAQLLAVALTREVCPKEASGPINFASTHPVVEIAVAPTVAVVKWDAPATAADPGLAPMAVQKVGTKPEGWTVTATARQAPAADFLNEVAEKSGLKVEWSTDARKQATGKTLTVAVEKMQLSELLRNATAVLDLGWELTDGRLALATLPPTPTPAQFAAARRALLEVTAAFPEHALAPVVGVELGNLEAAAGKWKEAAGWYERLLRDRPRSAVTTETNFNLGLARTRLGDRGLARDAFYRVIDRTPTGPLAPLAYLHIGKLYLEESNPTLATRALRRVQGSDANVQTRTCAGLLLSAAELLDDNPRAAHAALSDIRRNIGEEPFIRPACLLDALARYRAAVDPDRKERIAGDLLPALLAYGDEPLLGPLGTMLAGQAYRDLALPDQMTTFYQKAIPAVGPGLAVAMKADLAEHLFSSGKKGAAALFREVAAVPGPRAARAELHLAEIALRGKRPDECLTRCRKVLSAADADCGGEAVRLMGQAYTLQGNHAAAARCFAGRPPEVEATPAAVTQ